VTVIDLLPGGLGLYPETPYIWRHPLEVPKHGFSDNHGPSRVGRGVPPPGRPMRERW